MRGPRSSCLSSCAHAGLAGASAAWEPGGQVELCTVCRGGSVRPQACTSAVRGGPWTSAPGTSPWLGLSRTPSLHSCSVREALGLSWGRAAAPGRCCMRHRPAGSSLAPTSWGPASAHVRWARTQLCQWVSHRCPEGGHTKGSKSPEGGSWALGARHLEPACPVNLPPTEAAGIGVCHL